MNTLVAAASFCSGIAIGIIATVFFLQGFWMWKSHRDPEVEKVRKAIIDSYSEQLTATRLQMSHLVRATEQLLSVIEQIPRPPGQTLFIAKNAADEVANCRKFLPQKI